MDDPGRKAITQLNILPPKLQHNLQLHQEINSPTNKTTIQQQQQTAPTQPNTTSQPNKLTLQKHIHITTTQTTHNIQQLLPKQKKPPTHIQLKTTIKLQQQTNQPSNNTNPKTQTYTNPQTQTHTQTNNQTQHLKQ